MTAEIPMARAEATSMVPVVLRKCSFLPPGFLSSFDSMKYLAKYQIMTNRHIMYPI